MPKTFAKGHSATRPGLIAEWLCAKLGEAFGLPIPPFAIATAPDALVEAVFPGMFKGLGAGDVFASCKMPGGACESSCSACRSEPGSPSSANSCDLPTTGAGNRGRI